MKRSPHEAPRGPEDWTTADVFPTNAQPGNPRCETPLCCARVADLEVEFLKR
jgi:hypothetical protein